MRPKTPRLRAIPPEEWSAEAKDALAPVGAPGAAFPALNIFRTLANYPKLAKRWMVFANHILGKNSVPPREREILILRIGWLCRAEYEWAQHVVIGKREGLIGRRDPPDRRGPRRARLVGARPGAPARHRRAARRRLRLATRPGRSSPST